MVKYVTHSYHKNKEFLVTLPKDTV